MRASYLAPEENERLLVEKKYQLTQIWATDIVKHFVRLTGWITYADSRLNQKKSKHGNSVRGLKYFTLCGSDVIDIFHLYSHGLLYYDGRSFPDVVFCENKEEAFADASRRLGRTHGFQAQFESCIRNNQNFQNQFPFDLVNLDFTGVCFPKSEPPYSETLQALTK